MKHQTSRVLKFRGCGAFHKSWRFTPALLENAPFDPSALRQAQGKQAQGKQAQGKQVQGKRLARAQTQTRSVPPTASQDKWERRLAINIYPLRGYKKKSLQAGTPARAKGFNGSSPATNRRCRNKPTPSATKRP